jgi:hypothetical protein
VDRLLSWRAVASAKAAEDDANRQKAQDLVRIAREASLDIKTRYQIIGGKSGIYFANALRTTCSTFARLTNGGSVSLVARRSLGEGGRR